ncbi:LysM domain-containing protein [Roseivirga pacifica]|uniref:LysM domain-containing protein n=1 Tax=Roseivirga pacifica TaxID=1267423 RepID=A0A1I0P7W7_9BACT|nr:LysM peptidoglycan-binding domain-containing protein [Roseivirga pacifica]RKQ51727.1 LysM domain-containing protein [Roseivirga pacifica]SEW09623.1 LysM domain-containing protein [Roseivirga pacifica]
MRKFYSLIILLVVGLTSVSAQTDSLRMEQEGGKNFVIHKVLSGQTLYSLSKRYLTSVDAIKKENPTLASGLQVGQTLKIPYGGNVSAAPASATVTNEITHTVAAGETLFAISRKYNVAVADIKAWNSLSSNSLALNQKLKIRQEKAVSPQEVSQPQTTTEQPEEVTPTTTAPSEQPTETPKTDEVLVIEEAPQNNYPGSEFKQYEVEGVAEVIEEDEPSSKFFALHRTAKIGTVIKVRNLMNDLTVYVRVVGTIPETTDNENVIIKLNKRAYDNLKAIDKRFRVELSYFN